MMNKHSQYLIDISNHIYCQDLDEGNVTISTFNFRPRKTDQEKVLTCRAENTEVANSAIEDSWRIAVHCKYKKIFDLEFFNHLDLTNRILNYNQGLFLSNVKLSTINVGRRLMSNNQSIITAFYHWHDQYHTGQYQYWNFRSQGSCNVYFTQNKLCHKVKSSLSHNKLKRCLIGQQCIAHTMTVLKYDIIHRYHFSTEENRLKMQISLWPKIDFTRENICSL